MLILVYWEYYEQVFYRQHILWEPGSLSKKINLATLQERLFNNLGNEARINILYGTLLITQNEAGRLESGNIWIPNWILLIWLSLTLG